MTVFKDRHEYIGASECAKVLGRSKYGTPAEVGHEKLNPSEPTPTKPIFEIGHRLEPYLLKYACSELGYSHHDFDHQVEKRSESGIVRGHLDYLSKDSLVNIECKTTGMWSVSDWENDLPIDYFLQVHVQMQLSGALVTWLPVAIFDNNVRETLFNALPYVGENLDKLLDGLVESRKIKLDLARVDRDESFSSQLILDLESWWEAHIIYGIPFEPISLSDYKLLYQIPKYDMMQPDTETIELIKEYLDCKDAKKEIDKQSRDLGKKKDDTMLALLKSMGDYKGIKHDGITLTREMVKGRLTLKMEKN